MHIRRQTVGDILSRRDKWLTGNTTNGAKGHAKHTDLEQAFWLWFSIKPTQNVTHGISSHLLSVESWG